MTTADTERDEFERRDEVLAGEYVLGVIDIASRRAVEDRMATERRFARMVEAWEADLSPMNDAYEDVAPPRHVFERVESRLFPAASSARDTAPGFWNSLALWRGLTFASLLAVAGLALFSAGLLPQAGVDDAAPPLVAELTGENNPVSLVALYDAENGTVRLTPVAATVEDPRSLELWLIEGDNPPVSLGLVPDDGRGDIAIEPDMRARFAEGAVLAISLEPAGGSPTGSPTGPVVAAGAARQL